MHYYTFYDMGLTVFNHLLSPPTNQTNLLLSHSLLHVHLALLARLQCNCEVQIKTQTTKPTKYNEPADFASNITYLGNIYLLAEIVNSQAPNMSVQPVEVPKEKFSVQMRKATREVHSISDALVNAKLVFGMITAFLT